LANVERKLQKTFPELLDQWILAMALKGHPELKQPPTPLTIPSWDLADVMRGMHAADAARFRRAFPLIERELSSRSTDHVISSLRGGTGAVFTVHADPAADVLISLEGEFGGEASPTLRPAIVRVQ
jgi:hypothetical protein